MDHKAMIERRLNTWGLSVQEWTEDDDGDVVAVLGKAAPFEDDEDRHLYADGTEYELSAHVVGSEKYGNLRVCLLMTEEGTDRFAGEEVQPGDIELI